MKTAHAAIRDRGRDPRLDFFRGLGMFIILIAHIPGNPWTAWIPARFGHSDATEIFVFCSGAASAIAFLKVFETRGWWVGTARIAYRIWQIYWCHIAIFFVVLTALVMVDAGLARPGQGYVVARGLAPVLAEPDRYFPALFTLGYVPNYFDILVMYIVILALVPVMVALARIRTWLAIAASILLWALASQPWLALLDLAPMTLTDLPAEPVAMPRPWFFNPFAWQLVFFTGFALGAGWLAKPAVRPTLVLAALGMLAVSFGMERGAGAEAGPGAMGSKTYFGLLRYLHFLALAYLAWAMAGAGGRRLPRSGPAGGLVTIIRRVGQQALAVFIASLLIAQLIGVFIAEQAAGSAGARAWLVAAANLAGFAMIVAVAYTARYFRNPPWAARGPAPAS